MSQALARASLKLGTPKPVRPRWKPGFRVASQAVLYYTSCICSGARLLHKCFITSTTAGRDTATLNPELSYSVLQTSHVALSKLTLWHQPLMQTSQGQTAWIYLPARKERIPSYSYSSRWGFPRTGGTILGVLILRIIIYWGLNWGPTIQGNYQICCPICPVSYGKLYMLDGGMNRMTVWGLHC